jgi:thiol-disulfide isomerase/thioredoxin
MKTHLFILCLLFMPAVHAQQTDSVPSAAYDSLRSMIFRQLAEQGVFELKDKKLPGFRIRQVDGKEFESEGLTGKPTLFNFWFTACAPCVEEIPMLNRIQESYSHKVNFVAITYQDSVEISGFLERKPFNFTQLVAAEEYWKRLDIRSAPRTLLADEDLIVRYIDKDRPRDLKEFEAELVNQIKKVLKH